MSNRFDPYKEFLIRRKDRVVFCSPYPGNSGDTLIRMGTLELILRLGLKTTEIPEKADIILFPGGCPTMHQTVIDLIHKTIKQAKSKEIVIGPATFQFGHTNWPKIFNSEKVSALFARDAESFKNLKLAELRKNITISLSDDSALYLQNSKWLEKQKKTTEKDYILIAFRHDHEMDLLFCGNIIEQHFSFLPKKLLKKLTHWFKKRARLKRESHAQRYADNDDCVNAIDIANLDLHHYTDMIAKSKQIHTDRLHVMLLGAMLSKPVFAYKTSYSKLESVYNQSLKEWADVTFVDC